MKNLSTFKVLENQFKLATPDFRSWGADLSMTERYVETYFYPRVGNYHIIGFSREVCDTLCFDWNLPESRIGCCLQYQKVYAGKIDFFENIKARAVKRVWRSDEHGGTRKDKSGPIIKANKKYFDRNVAEDRDYFLLGVYFKLNVMGMPEQIFPPVYALSASRTTMKVREMRLEQEKDPFKGKDGLEFSKIFYRLWEDITRFEPLMLMSLSEYENRLNLVSKALNEWLLAGLFNDRDIGKYNKLLLLPSDNPLEKMFTLFVDYIGQELERRGKVRVCKNCKEVFTLGRNSSFCSTECSKSQSDKIRYQRKLLKKSKGKRIHRRQNVVKT